MPNYTARMQYFNRSMVAITKPQRGQGRILDEFCKSASTTEACLRLLHRPVPKAKPPRLSRHRAFAYSPVVLQAAA